jgi:SWI/SNF-related matrix-associated actin-dependent regulator 1 of chromatin subfamily A
MLRGYEAVDSLIHECENLGNEVAEGVKQWGVDIRGEDCEIEITEVEVGSEADEEDGVKVKRGSGGYFTEKPKLLAEDVELKNYQQVGVNWLNLLYKRGLSCILADEMGLGKTCQVIAFLAHLKEKNIPGPHLVVVPSSTLENWLREFNRFCPTMAIEPYYGTQNERADMREQLINSGMKFDVLVTTYNLACGSKMDHGFLKSQNFNVCVYDEGHLLKNSQSERFTKLMRLKAKFRLLLTGTPLQNNLKELVSLLLFILPNLFQQRREDLQSVFKHKAKATGETNRANPLLSEQRIAKAKTMMTPFVLRRRKDQVLRHLPEKSHAIEYCDMSEQQKEVYDKELEKSRAIITARENGDTSKNVPNILMQLRKASLHPLLFRRLYSDSKLKVMAKEIMKEDRYKEASQQFIYEDMEVMSDFELNRLCEAFPKTIGKHKLKEREWMTSGKVAKLEQMLPEMKERGDKILLFSQFTQMLDILEKVLNRMGISFLRLDGQTPVEIRQEMIDKFHDEDDITVFLLSTKAGGFGINLACANVVVIYDLSFNPHDDKQAEDRAHRVGQTRDVSVIRMVTKDSIEENILTLANTKLELDRSVSEEAAAEKVEQAGASLVAKMLFKGTKDDSRASSKDPKQESEEPTETKPNGEPKEELNQ